MAHQLDLFDTNRQARERDRHDAYARMRDSLLDRHPGQDDIIQLLALASVRQREGDGRRIVVRSPDGANLSGLLRSLSEVAGLIYWEFSAPDLAETNWTGTDLGFHISQLMRSAAHTLGNDRAPQAAEHACILVRRLDGIRLQGEYASASTRDHRLGQQSSLIPLIAGHTISADRLGGISWNAQGAIVVATAQFADLPAGTPDVADLVAWGMLPELAESLGSAAWLHVRPPTPAATAAAVIRELPRMVTLFAQWGYRLLIADQVVRFVCRAVGDGPYSGGSAAAVAWIEAACERLLLRMIDDGAPHGDSTVLAVDDLNLPLPPKGIWRE